MYSRKFGQNGLPPDYSGVSFRYQAPEGKPGENAAFPQQDDDCAPARAPRYPVEKRKAAPVPRKFTVKRPPPPKNVVQPAKKEDPPPRPSSGIGALSSHSFTMEDIVLAGLILLLLNSECDSELLLVLGFLLLVGLQ